MAKHRAAAGRKAWFARVGALGAAIAVLAALVGIPQLASATSGVVSLTVKLTSKSGSAITGANVVAVPVDPTAYTVDGGYWDAAITASTVGLPSGSYGLQLATGQDYVLAFQTTTSSSSALFDQFYGGASTIGNAKLVEWDDAGSHELSASVQTHSTLTGKVTNSSGTAAKGIGVFAYRYSGSDWVLVDSALSNSSGSYSLFDLDPGSYRLWFTDFSTTGYFDTFSGGKADFDDAIAYWTGLGQSVTVPTVKLTTGAKISGSATLEGFGKASDIYAVAYPLIGTPGSYIGIDHGDYYVGPTVSESKPGTWTVGGLPVGHYIVELFDAFSPPNFESTYVGGTSGVQTWQQAQVFDVTKAGQSLTASHSTTMAAVGNAGLQTYTVHVQDFHSDPVAGAEVWMNGSGDGDYTAQDGTPVVTDSHGDAIFGTACAVGEDCSYSPGQLRPGTYTLYVYTGSAEAPDYEPVRQSVTVSDDPTGFGSTTVTLESYHPLTWSTSPFSGCSGVCAPDPSVGDTLSVGGAVTPHNGASPQYLYQWFRDGSPIFGGTSSSYQLAAADAGHTVTGTIEAIADGYAGIRWTSSEFDVQAGGQLQEMTSPFIATASGQPQGGSVATGTKLYATGGTWSANSNPVSDVSFGYQWTLTGPSVADAHHDGSSYTVTASDADTYTAISLTVTPTRLGYAPPSPASVTTAPIAIAPLAAPTLKKAPTFSVKHSGATTTYKASSAGTWSIKGTGTFEWYADGVDTGMSGATFVNPGTFDGQTITAVETYTISGRVSGTATFYVAKGIAPDVVETGSNVAYHAGGTAVSSGQPTFALHPFDTLLLSGDGPQRYADAHPTAGAFTVTLQWEKSKNGTSWSKVGSAQHLSGYGSDSTQSPLHTVALGEVGYQLRADVTVSSQGLATRSHDYYVFGTVGASPDLANAVASGGVNLYGSGVIGTPITASVLGGLTGGITSVKLSYTWDRCSTADPACADGTWAAISKATKTSYTPTAADLGHTLRFHLTAKKTGYANGELTSVVSNAISVSSGVVNVLVSPEVKSGIDNGTHAKVGRPIVMTPAKTDVSGTVAAYQWYSCDRAVSACDPFSFTPIPGATKSAYTPTGDLYNTGMVQLFVTETVSKKDGTSPRNTNGPVVDLDTLGDLTFTKAPSVKATSGAYTLSVGTTSPASTPVITWIVDGTGNGNSSTVYSRSGADAGHGIAAVIGYLAPGYAPALPRMVVAQKITVPTVSAPPTGSTYGDTFQTVDIVSAPTWSQATRTYTWYVGSTKKGTGFTYTPSASYVGKKITFSEKVTSPYFSTVTKKSAAVTLQAATLPTPTVTYTNPGLTAGTPVGATVTWAGVSLSYQWYSGSDGSTWTKISGATKSSYTPSSSYVNKHLRLVVTGKKTGYHTATSDSGDLGQVTVIGTLQAISPPSIGAAQTVGVPITVDLGQWNTTGIAFSYTWLRNGAQIYGATGSTFTPTAEFAGDHVSVVVSATKTGWTSGSVASAEALVQSGAAPTATTVPKITVSGSAPSVTLTASTGAWTLGNLTYTYAWNVNGSPVATSGSSVYDGPALTVGESVTVTVTATSPGYADGLAPSAAVIVH